MLEDSGILYEHIRQFCKSESAKNITCPKFVVPKREKDVFQYK